MSCMIMCCYNTTFLYWPSVKTLMHVLRILFQKAFETIYNKQLWGEHGEEEVDQSANSYKASGPGSSLEAAQVYHALHTALRRKRLRANSVTLFRPLEFTIKLQTIESEYHWRIHRGHSGSGLP